MFGNPMGSNSTSVSYSQSQSRQESIEYQRWGQKPQSTQSAEDTKNVESAPKSSRAEGFNVDALVDQIWSFASARIAKAESNGASEEELDGLWNAAKKGVSQGFGEAKDILEDLGQLDEDLEMKINNAFGQLMDKLDARDLTPSEKPALSNTAVTAEVADSVKLNRAINLYQYERQTFAMDITTAQGDRIQIRSVAEQSASIQDSSFGSQSATKWGMNEESGFSLFIKGDLNQQELADLDKLLAEVNELANEFYNGDMQTAFEKATALNINGTSLRTMDLSMKEVEQKGASVYAATQDESSRLPKGLSPLKEYAERLLQAQEQWQQRFQSPEGLMSAIKNHPLNNGDFLKTSQFLM